MEELIVIGYLIPFVICFISAKFFYKDVQSCREFIAQMMFIPILNFLCSTFILLDGIIWIFEEIYRFTIK